MSNDVMVNTHGAHMEPWMQTDPAGGLPRHFAPVDQARHSLVARIVLFSKVVHEIRQIHPRHGLAGVVGLGCFEHCERVEKQARGCCIASNSFWDTLAMRMPLAQHATPV